MQETGHPTKRHTAVHDETGRMISTHAPRVSTACCRAPQMNFIGAAVRAGGALHPTDLGHFSDTAPHLQLLCDLLGVEGLTCHDDEDLRSIAQQSALHACFRPNPRLAHLLYAWLRTLGYSPSQILEASHMAVQDAQIAPAFERFEASLPDIRQDMPLPACLRKDLLATT
jgi:hypothetical protein